MFRVFCPLYEIVRIVQNKSLKFQTFSEKIGVYMMSSETIAAIATPLSNSGIGIIRISGEDAFSVIDRIFMSAKGNKKLSEVKSHTVHYGYIMDSDRKIDEVLVVIMRGKNTYTGEDTVEIDCHGGVFVMKKILDIVIRNGARPAEPGEFTKRAFLNGRIDLSQAEAVIDIIHSKTDYALTSSLNQLKGSVTDKIKSLRERVLHHIAFIEAALDDPEHISLDHYEEELLIVVKDIKNELKKLIDTSDNGKIYIEGIKTVILGKPNVGKSSFLNALIGEERAIVTDIAGTTRDTLEEHINMNGIHFNIIDTAGIRKTDDVVEKIGVEKAKKAAEEADLIILILDSSLPLDENDYSIINTIRHKKAILLLNKSDLKSEVTEDMLSEVTDMQIIPVSVKENVGLEQFQQSVLDMFYQGEISFNDEVTITNARHKALIMEAYESIQLVENSITDGLPEDFYSIDLMNAYEKLGLVIGEAIEDDLVNQIFSKFCMGK